VGFPKWFAMMSDPVVFADTDAELYQAVKKNNGATIYPFDETGMRVLRPIKITPQEFCEKWQGD
jgi:hypothetical protein